MNRFMRGKVVLLFVLLTLQELSEAVYKRFARNTNFDNTDNWNEGVRLPCPNEPIDFPETCPVVLIKQDYGIKEMRLPANGMIVLDSDIELTFNDHPVTEGTSCKFARGITFVNDRPSNWLDPENWCVPKFDMGIDCLEDPPLLDTEKVPCYNDDVIFTEDSSYFVNMDFQEDIYVRSFQLERTLFTTQMLEEYFRTVIGFSQFRRPLPPNRHKVQITGHTCFNDTGCQCGNDIGWIKEQICDIMRDKDECYTKAQCTNWFIPVGHCCQTCGSMIVVDYTADFHKIRFKQFVEDSYINSKESAYSHTKVIVSKRFDDAIQIVLTDTVNGQEAAILGPILVDKINEAPQIQGIARIISIITSGLPQTTTTSTPGQSTETEQSTTNSGANVESTTTIVSTTGGSGTNSKPLPLEAIAGLSASGVVVLALVILGIACLVVRRGHSIKTLSFKKKLYGPDIHADFSDPTNPSVRGFDNPVYGENPIQGTPLQDMHARRLSAMGGFDNPLYDNPMQETFYNDPSKTDSNIIRNPVYDSIIEESSA